uniref:Uncharacterized protein n=1 Tax=Acrobeloides nanus TaxID=290746 RepID=A0A914CUI6_9BILA
MGKNSGKIARFNPNSYRRNSTSNKAVYTHELEVPQIDRPLRHVHCNSVTLEHVKVDYIVLQALKRSLKYSFRQMDFLYCMLNVNNQAEFAYLLREWNVQELSFAHCNWPENSEFYSISDKLFEFNPQLQHVSISFDKVTNIKISDTTLKKWASCTSWPRSFILHNVKSEITHEGVAAVISSYVAQARAKRDKVFGSTILWNFGVVNTSLDWLTRELTSLEPHIRYLKQIPHGIHLKIQVCPTVPALHVRLVFAYRSLRVLKKNISLPTVLATL